MSIRHKLNTIKMIAADLVEWIGMKPEVLKSINIIFRVKNSYFLCHPLNIR